jgi:outer membrane protein assembly factor BamB
MRRVVLLFRVSVAVALFGWLAVAWAEKPKDEKEEEVARPPTTKGPSPLEKMMSAQEGEPSTRAKPAKKSPPSSTRAKPPPRRGSFMRGSVAANFTSKEGIKGWSVAIPGNQALSTPAVVDRIVFLGGGLNSHDFGALDAETGKLLWHYTAADNGPTAPVVSANYVTFSTESCEVEVLTTAGKPVWKKHLGSPLTAMPAVANGRLIVSYPAVRGTPGNFLGALNLKTGEELWTTRVAGEIIVAPVIEREHVLVATVGGVLHCLGIDDGKLLWTDEGINATSSPTVWNGRCWFSRRQEVSSADVGPMGGRQTEHVAFRGLDADSNVRSLPATNHAADYLDWRKNLPGTRMTVGRAPGRPAAANRRPANPFAEVAEESAGGETGTSQSLFASLPEVQRQRGSNLPILTAQNHLGLNDLSGIWAYQGSRPLFYEDRLYAPMGDTLLCIDAKTGKTLWKKEFRPEQRQTSKTGRPQPDERLLNPTLAPPVLANHKVFIGTSYGEVRCLSAKTGDLLWRATIGAPVVSQPVVAEGRLFLATTAGRLFCLETGDPDDDGWFMWGANPAHTGNVGKETPEQARHEDDSLRVSKD